MFPEPFIEYLYQYHIEKDYYECHEILEEYWKLGGMARDSVWVTLIQAAVGYYHYRRGNDKGAKKLIAKVIRQIPEKKSELQLLGIDDEEWLARLQDSESKLLAGESYQSVLIPLADPDLISEIVRLCQIRGQNWSVSKDKQPNARIIHKHLYQKPVSSRSI